MSKTSQRAKGARDERIRTLARDRQQRKRERDRVTRHAVADSTSSRAGQRRTRPDEVRVASRKNREAMFSIQRGRLANPDQTLQKHGHGRISLYGTILHVFPDVAGYCRAWVDHLLTNELAIKPAKAMNPADQPKADDAAERMKKAFAQVRNRLIVIQQLPLGRFFGFARAEKVARFDEIVKEWIPDLYDVDQEFWKFDVDGNDYLVTQSRPEGIPVDPYKFVHFQWGTSDTKYGHGDLSFIYSTLWKIQQLETILLRRIEDNESTVIVHVPRNFGKEDRDKTRSAFEEHYDRVISLPSDGTKAEIDTPEMSLISSGATGRPEEERIQAYERRVQIKILGAPQTGNKQLGTGKVEETRKAVWDDKTPLGLAAIDQCLNEGWRDTYCGWNMADLPVELWPRFESDASDITEGLTGIQVENARNIALDFSAKRITATVAIELWTSLGMPRARAQSMADSIGKERDDLETVSAETTTEQLPKVDPADEPDEEDIEPEQKVGLIVENADGTPTAIEFSRSAMIMTDRGEIPADLLPAASGAEIITRRLKE